MISALIQSVEVPEAAIFSLSLFILMFIALLFWVFVMNPKSEWEKRAHIPLLDDHSSERKNV